MIVQVRAVNELWQVRNYQMSRTSEYDRCILSCRPSFLTVEAKSTTERKPSAAAATEWSSAIVKQQRLSANTPRHQKLSYSEQPRGFDKKSYLMRGSVSLHLKKRMVKASVRSVALCRSKTWTLQKKKIFDDLRHLKYGYGGD